jgi:hypothetical protein
MLRASRRKPDLERLRPRDQLVLECLCVDWNRLAGFLINSVLDTESPQHCRKHTELRTLSELDTRTDAAASSVGVVIAVLVVLACSVLACQTWVIKVAVGIVSVGLIVLRVVESPVGNHYGGIFGLDTDQQLFLQYWLLRNSQSTCPYTNYLECRHAEYRWELCKNIVNANTA